MLAQDGGKEKPRRVLERGGAFLVARMGWQASTDQIGADEGTQPEYRISQRLDYAMMERS